MNIFRISALALAAGMACAVGCGSCIGSNLNSNGAPPVSCGPGTYDNNGICVKANTPVKA